MKSKAAKHASFSTSKGRRAGLPSLIRCATGIRLPPDSCCRLALLSRLAVLAGVGRKIHALAGWLQLAQLFFVGGDPVLPDVDLFVPSLDRILACELYWWVIDNSGQESKSLRRRCFCNHYISIFRVLVGMFRKRPLPMR